MSLLLDVEVEAGPNEKPIAVDDDLLAAPDADVKMEELKPPGVVKSGNKQFLH